MVQVAKKEIKKEHPSLVFRKYIFGSYAQATNTFTGGIRLDWAGVSHHPCQIVLTDNASMVQAGVAVDPAFPLPQEDQANQFGRPAGVNFVASRYGLDGTRLGYRIRIRGISLQIRARLDQCQDLQPLFDKVFVKFALVSYHDAASPLPATQLVPEEGMSMKRWGYVAKIDQIEKAQTSSTCHLKHWGSGGFYLPVKTLDISEKFVSKFWKLNMNYEYGSDDPLAGHVQSQYGQRVVGPKLFIILRATTPVAAPASYKPLIQCVYKVNYTNEV